MLEIEMKFPLADFSAIEKRFAEWNVALSTSRDEADFYFNAPDRDFGVTDEALRLRCIGETNCVTYKGPKQQGVAKIRREIEVRLENGEGPAAKFREILVQLNYRPSAVVRKTRRVYRLERQGFPLEITLDEVHDLGRFMEIEIVANETDSEKAQAVVAELARDLSLSNPEPRSYLEMVLEKNQ